MMNPNKWDKCVDVINRLSSRVKNEQNQSTMVDNDDNMIPLCIDKSFYQYKSNIGQEYCVEVCGNCPDSIKLSNGVVKNTNINDWEKPICDTEINQQFSNPIDPYQHLFASSNIFDNKNKYIDYIVTNVLRQVVNHIPFDSLHQLSCCLPKNIEDILRNTDIDSDRLIRILVTEVLQCYSTNTGQLTDWYAFANLFKPLLPPTKDKDYDNEEVDKTRNKLLSKPKQLPKNKKKSERILNNHIKTTLSTTPASSVNKKGQSSDSIAFNKIVSSTTANISPIHRTPSTGVTPQIMSVTNSMTPMTKHSKEIFTPIGSNYQSKSKSNQNLIFDKSTEIDHHDSLPFREKSTNRSSSNRSRTQHQILSDSHHYDHKSNKSSDQSSSNDCVLTIHHKHKHKTAHNHYRRDKHHTTTNFDIPSSRSLSSHTSVPIKEFGEKCKRTFVDTSPLMTDAIPAQIISRQNISFNSATAEQLKMSDLLNDEQTLLFKLFISSDNTTKNLHEIENSSFQLSPHDTAVLSPHDTAVLSPNNIQQLARLMYEYSIVDNSQLPSSKDLKKCALPSSDNHAQMDANLIPLEKKVIRINHYPNMLADFD